MLSNFHSVFLITILTLVFTVELLKPSSLINHCILDAIQVIWKSAKNILFLIVFLGKSV